MMKSCLTFALALTLCMFGTLSQGEDFDSVEPLDLGDQGKEDVYLTIQLTNVPQEEEEKWLQKFKDVFGAGCNPETKRHIGFGARFINLLKDPPEKLREQVNRALDMAEKYDMPVYFQLDDMHYLNHELAQDPNYCEWARFPEEGETHGPIMRYWYNWGMWACEPAIPCFASPHFQKFVRRQLREGFFYPLIQRLNKWEVEGKLDYFAGVSIGWETHIPDYTPGAYHYFLDRLNPPVSIFVEPPLVMKQWEMTQAGSAALHWRGWTPETLEQEAKERTMTLRRLKQEILHDVIRNYTATLSLYCHRIGLPRHKVFTHIVPLDSLPDSQPSTTAPPIQVAVNPWSTPGFTLSRATARYDMAVLKKRIQEVDPEMPHFACAETYFRGVNTRESFSDFLNELLQAGCVHINIMGYTDPPESPFNNFEKEEAIAVCREWMAGKF